MVDPELPNLSVSDWLPEHPQGPIGRATLALFARASNDHIPLHIDSDFAKSAGMPDVLAPGVLPLAVAQLLTRWLPPDRLRSMRRSPAGGRSSSSSRRTVSGARE